MISNFFFFFQVERLLLLQMYWNIFFLLPKHLWWVSVQLMMMVSVQCPFFKEAFGRLVSTSQWLPFSEDVCIIVIFFYLPFCQYLVWKVAYCPLLSSFFPSSSFQICNVPISCLLVRTQSGLVFPIRGRVCVRAQASCLCFLTVLFHFTHNHIQSFCIDLTPKFCNTWVKVTALSLFFGQVIHFFFFF